MTDLILLAVGLGFALLTRGLIRLCERVSGLRP